MRSHAGVALETALGTELIDRNTPGVALTYTAEQVLPHVRDVFASLQRIPAIALAGQAGDLHLRAQGG